MTANKTEAMKLFRKGLSFYRGDGVQKNKKTASSYFYQGAEKGNIMSMLYYAQMLSEGDGIEMNRSLSASYYKKIWEMFLE